MSLSSLTPSVSFREALVAMRRARSPNLGHTLEAKGQVQGMRRPLIGGMHPE
jgi:hypothetical protein